MKKVVRTVWISALSGLAFLGACCSQRGLTRAERKRLTKERETVEQTLNEKMNVDVDGLDQLAFFEHNGEIYALMNKLDSIDFRLGKDIDLDRNIRRRKLQQRLDSLDYLIENYIPPRIYGSPEMMDHRPVDLRYEELEQNYKKTQQELEEFDRTQTKVPETYELLYGGPTIRYEKQDK